MPRPDGATERAVERARSDLPDPLPTGPVVFGFDGYVDRVREVVADRHDAETTERMATLAALADRVGASAAADSSLSIEWYQTDVRTGGHTAHLGRVYGGWGFEPTMIGTYGDPIREAFAADFGDATLHTLGAPGETDAVEFDDGKLMLIENGASTTVTWDAIGDRVGWSTLASVFERARLLGVGYWAETPRLPTVLRGLADQFHDLESPPELVLVDPGDVRKLSDERLAAGADAFDGLSDATRVVLSANVAETRRLATQLAGWPAGGSAADADAERREAASAVRRVTGVDVVVCHGQASTLAAGPTGGHRVAVPRTSDPVLTTSAGDHFNAGCSLGLLAGLDVGAALGLGNAVAGWFVRNGEAPSPAEVRTALERYEDWFEQ